MMKKLKLSRNIFSNQEGSIIVTFAILLNILVLAIALSMDLGRAYMADSAISGAADAAAIASAVDNGDATKAQEYFQSNLPTGTLGIEYSYATDVQHAIDPATGDISVSTSGFDVPAYFSRGSGNAGGLALSGQTVVGSPSSTPVPADIVIIMDASGSMGPSFGAVAGSQVTNRNIAAVLNGTATTNGLNVAKSEALEASIFSLFQVIFENGNPVAADGELTYRISFKSYDSGLRGNEAFSGDLQTLMDYFPSIITPGTSTNPGVALQAGRGELANSLSGRRNIYIFLTDGDFNQTGGGTHSWPADFPNPPSGNEDPHEYAATECNLIKQDPDVDFWAIGFGASANNGLNFDVMEYCASVPSQYLQPTSGDELQAIFTQIATQLTRVRVKQ